MAWLLESDYSELPYSHHLNLNISVLLLEIYQMACKQTWLSNFNQDFTVFKCRLQNKLLKLFFVFQNEQGPKRSVRATYAIASLCLTKLSQVENWDQNVVIKIAIPEMRSEQHWVKGESFQSRLHKDGKHRALRDPGHTLALLNWWSWLPHHVITSPLQDIKFYFTEGNPLGFYFRTSLTPRMNTWMKTGKRGCHDIYL